MNGKEINVEVIGEEKIGKKNNSLNLIQTVFFLFILVAFICTVLGFTTGLGKIKSFRFFLGTASMVIAMAQSFEAGYKISRIDFYTSLIWFCVGLMHFIQSTWILTN